MSALLPDINPLIVIFSAWLLVILCLMPSVRQWTQKGFVAAEQQVARQLESFHIFINPQSIHGGLVVGMIISVVLCLLLMRSVWLLPLAAVAVAAALIALIRLRVKQRFKRIRHQLPAVMELLATTLRAGLSVRAALIQVSRQAPAPISQELAVLERMQRIGIPLDDALKQWSDRVPVEEIGLFGFAVSVSTASGGNLADALDRLAATFRARLVLEDKVDALTAQGRLQAWVMVALPVLLALALTAIDPDAMGALWFTGLGHAVLAGVLVLEVLGLCWIRRLIRVDI
jgi:tight adherence protein B